MRVNATTALPLDHDLYFLTLLETLSTMSDTTAVAQELFADEVVALFKANLPVCDLFKMVVALRSRAAVLERRIARRDARIEQQDVRSESHTYASANVALRIVHRND